MNFHGGTFIAGYTYKTHYIHNVSWVMLLELGHCSRNAGILRMLMCYYDATAVATIYYFLYHKNNSIEYFSNCAILLSVLTN